MSHSAQLIHTGLGEMVNVKTDGPALFIAVLWNTGDANAVYWNERQWGVNAFVQVLSGLKLKRDEVKVKLIGAPSLVKAAESELFSRWGIFPEKSIQREGAFELYFYPASGRIRLAAAAKKIRLLIVDDSKTIRDLLSRVFSSDPEIEIVAALERPSQVMEALDRLKPDVITLDIHMPEMDGVSLLKQYMLRHRIPTVMISSISRDEGPMVLNALEAGAVDYIQKPSLQQLTEMKSLMIEKVKAASRIDLKSKKKISLNTSAIGDPLDPSYFIAIGSSTGGTNALKDMLIRMPDRIPPILIVQHIPAVFSHSLAERLNSLCRFEVKEAQDGDVLTPNRVLIAPGGKQMKVVKDGTKYRVKITDDAPVNRHKPSVDYLFDSVAQVLANKPMIGIMLTGMGADGANGMLKMKKNGARTIAQDEESCVVFGMPQAAIRAGGVDEVVSLCDIPAMLHRWIGLKKSA